MNTKNSTQKKSIKTSIQKLKNKNHQLQLTIEHTTSQTTPAQIKNTNELHTIINKLKNKLSTLHNQLTTTTKNQKHFEKKITKIHDTIKHETTGTNTTYQEHIKQIIKQFHTIKKHLIHTKHELHMEHQLTNNNNQTYQITLKQLDLTQNQIYNLQTNTSPNQQKNQLLQSLNLKKTPIPTNVHKNFPTTEKTSIENNSPNTHNVTNTPSNNNKSNKNTLIPTNDETSLKPKTSSKNTNTITTSTNTI